MRVIIRALSKQMKNSTVEKARTAFSRTPRIVTALACLLWLASNASADEIKIAVASNFSGAMQALVRAYEAGAPHKVILVFGATGKHYAQIKNGAPFEAFLAADVRRPALLESEGIAIPGSRFTYALGKLVLWSPQPDYVDSAGTILSRGRFMHLALANPRLAPYGVAAQEVLQARGLWQSMQSRLVRGENIGQAYQFTASGNAELGFVAYAQIKQAKPAIPGSYWLIPASLYSAIEQQAVLLRDNAAARNFLHYLQTNKALKIIRDYGYDTP